MRKTSFPIVGGSYADEDKPWSMQDTVNFLPVMAERAGTRSGSMLKTPPGLKPFARYVVNGEVAPPVRGLYNAEGRLFAVIGTTFCKITSAGEFVPLGTVPGIGRVAFTHNQISLGNEVVIANGSAGYVYNTVTDTFSRITDPGFPGAFALGFIDGFVLGIEPQGRFAFNSAPANAADYNTLDRFTSEVRPDRLVSLAVSNNELMLLSSESCEFFENTGATQQPFRSKRIALDKGCGGPYTVVTIDNTVMWLGSDGIIYRLESYTPRRISTRPIEQAIRGLNWQQAFAFSWIDSGFTVAYWTFPDGMTWGYDVASGEWHRRESKGFSRWRVNCMAKWNGSWYAGDMQNGRVWSLDWDYILEGDQEIVSERTLGVMHDDQNLVRAPLLELVMDTGRAETVPVGFKTDVASFVATDGNGGGDGRFWIQPSSAATDAFTAALAAAEAIVITGLLETNDDLSGIGGQEMPLLSYDEYTLDMEFNDPDWSWYNDAAEFKNDTWFWARIEVDGVTFYGALYMGSGI